MVSRVGRITTIMALLFMVATLTGGWAGAAEEENYDFLGDDMPAVVESKDNFDPMEPMNRFFFRVNDKLYFWAFKPVARGYSAVVPKDVRRCIGDFFHNLLTPVRLINCLLQGKGRGAGMELSRFVINSTLGIVGLADPAQDKFDLPAQDEDLGQTLGYYGLGDKLYICWPFFGPSNARDTVGAIGDIFFSPLGYLSYVDSTTGFYVQGGQRVNQTSLKIGEYEQFLEASFDPYVAMREAYQQNRRAKIEDRGQEKREKR